MKTAKAGDWNTTPLPPKRAGLQLNRVFSAEEMERIRRGVIPEEMEDKWFTYWEDGTLYCHRSWTGICLYAVKFVPEGDGHRMVEAEANRDPEQYQGTDDKADAALISYLIDVLLLHRPVDFPLAGDSPEQQALMMWGFAGRAMLGQHPEEE